MKKQTNQRKKKFKLNKTQHNSVALRYAKWNLQREHAIVREWQDRRTHTTSIIRKKVLTLTFTMKTYTCHSFLTLYCIESTFRFFLSLFFFFAWSAPPFFYAFNPRNLDFFYWNRLWKQTPSFSICSGFVHFEIAFANRFSFTIRQDLVSNGNHFI